ncbi:MAG TPA: hypothetical protein VK866_17965 [Acidimicrobiales bacterium]|nr:hypothetical protein [Acidimicrobiales bacterium]
MIDPADPSTVHPAPRRRSARRTLMAGLAVMALVLAACGDDDDGGLSSSERGELIAELTADSGLSEDQAGCVLDSLLDELGLDGLRAIATDDEGAEFTDEQGVAVFAAFEECDVDIFGDLGEGEGGGIDSDAQSYGDDPELDALWDACEGGDGQACDDLFFQSPIGSEYEEFGDTCGGRFEAGEVFCAQEL